MIIESFYARALGEMRRSKSLFLEDLLRNSIIHDNTDERDYCKDDRACHESKLADGRESRQQRLRNESPSDDSAHDKDGDQYPKNNFCHVLGEIFHVTVVSC